MPNMPKQVLHPQYHLQCVIGHVWLQDKLRRDLESIDNTVYATISKANWNKTWGLLLVLLNPFLEPHSESGDLILGDLKLEAGMD